MNGHASSPMDYTSRLEGFRRSDSERDAFVAELLRNFQALELKYTEKCDDYNNEVESRRMWQSKAKISEVALIEQKQASGSNNFALAVIDGDGAVVGFALPFPRETDIAVMTDSCHSFKTTYSPRAKKGARIVLITCKSVKSR